MLKLRKYLKPFIASILAIIVLLFAQAMCELAMPDYMSNIVNVGITSGGIEDGVLEAVRESEYDKLKIFMDEKQQKVFTDNYELQTSSNADKGMKEKYPALEKENVYLLKDVDKDTREKVKLALSEAETCVMVLEQTQANLSSEDIANLTQEQKDMMDMLKKLPQGVDVFNVLKMMPKEQLADMQKEITKKSSLMGQDMMDSSNALYAKAEYKKVGMDTDAIQYRYLFTNGGLMLLVALGSAVAAICVGFLASKVAAGFSRNLRKDVFQKVENFSNVEFNKFSTNTLITRTTNDVQQVQMVMVMILRMVIYAPIIGIGALLKVINSNADMTWIIGLVVAVIIGIMATAFAFVLPKFRIQQKLMDKLNSVVRELLDGMPVIRAFNNQKIESQKFHKSNHDIMKTQLFVSRSMGFLLPIIMFVMNMSSILIVWVGSHQINDGVLMVGDMMAFIQYAMQIIMSFLMICMISVMLPRAAVSAERVDEVLKSETKIHDPKEPKTLPKNGKGEVAFEHVSFHYPGAEEDVLHDITFTAKPGETTAFIGSTGCGKSTLVNLIPRFYDVTEGKITIDGQDVRDLTQHELRDKLGYVPQKGVLFSGNIASNIMFGNPAGSEQEMTEAAQIAQAVEFIDTKPERYKSPISQGGANVSGGQKQRLSIARAIAKHPDVYIFDDSFSALDYKTDTVLRSALKEKTTDSVVLIVAQRISTILHAEQIIVLDDGKIVGKGTHEELLKTCDAYYQIAASQLSESELKEAMKEED